MGLFSSSSKKAKIIRTPAQWGAESWLSDLLDAPTPDFPTQGVAGMTEAEKMAMGMATGYAKSTPEGMDTLRSFTSTAPYEGLSPEIQSLLDEVMQRGQEETNRVGRKVQLAGAGRSGTGQDVLGRSVEDTQRNMMNVALPYVMQAKENAENRKLTAAESLATLGENSMLNRINALSTTGSLPRILEQLKKDAEYAKAMNQINFPYQQANIASAILNGQTPMAVTGGEPSTFEQMSPLIGLLGGLF